MNQNLVIFKSFIPEIPDLRVDSKEIFGSSADFSKKSEFDLINTDIKTFHNNGKTFKVSQIISMNVSPILERKEKLIEELSKLKNITECEHIILIITDLLTNSSYLLYDDSQLTSNFLQKAFNKEVNQGMHLRSVVSRKKQVIPLLMEVE